MGVPDRSYATAFARVQETVVGLLGILMILAVDRIEREDLEDHLRRMFQRTLLETSFMVTPRSRLDLRKLPGDRVSDVQAPRHEIRTADNLVPAVPAPTV